MLNNNIQKNSISKAKVQLFIQKRRTREEIANLTKQQRSSIYDHRSRHAKLNKAKRIARSLVTGSKKISFYLLMTVPTEKKRERSIELYIYNNNITTKRVSNFKHMNLQKKGVYGMSNWATMNVNKILNNENVEADIVERKKSDNAYYATSDRVKNAVNSIKTRHSVQSETKKQTETGMRSNVSSYKTYVHRDRYIPAISQEEALQKIVTMANNPFFSSMPKHEAAEMLRNIMEQMMEEKNR